MHVSRDFNAGWVGVVFWLFALSESGWTAGALPAYEPEMHVAGTVAVSGDAADRDLIEALQAAYVMYQPEVRFRNNLYGPESTLAAVYTGTADLAFMAREIREPMERMAFEWVKLTKPFAVQYANAGFGKDRPGTQLAVFVHVDNPVDSLSMAQLDAIFGAEHKRGLGNVRIWDDLNTGGECRNRAVHVLGPKLDSVPALFFRRVVMRDSRKWNPGFREFDNVIEALHALSRNACGIALAPMALGTPGVRPLAIASGEGERAIALTRETAISQEYPLYRSVSMILHRPENEAVAPRIREFLRFVLSAQGQAIIDQAGSYLPLDGPTVVLELSRLER